MLSCGHLIKLWTWSRRTNMDIRRELHFLRDTVHQIGTSVSRFLEEKTLELNEVKQKIERILDHVEKGGRKRPALDSDDSEVPVSYKKLRPEKDGALSDNIKQLKTNGFIIGQDGYVEVHTDGACEKNGTPAAKAGVGVWWNADHKSNISKPLEGLPQTNNRAEIQAAIEAITEAKRLDIRRLAIHSDSKLMIDSITKWLPGWRRNGWKTKKNEPVKNRRELETLQDHIHGNGPKVEVRWVHVRGHNGIVGNEAADFLAKQGIDKKN